jgi:hypothetical protein
MLGKSLFISAVLAGLLLSGCCGTTGNIQNSGQSNTSSHTQQTESPKSIENGQLGTVYTVEYMGSKYEVTLTQTAFETTSSIYGGKRYLLANFEIKNVGDGSEYFAPDIYAIDSSSEKYDKTIAFGISDKYDKTLDSLKKLTPGTKMSGWAAIEVPSDVNNFDLYFEYTNSFVTKTPMYIKYKIIA